ncbi:MAG TPA: M48 family metallopeptidase [Vicinamibacterales bacterium]|nr:M48 family metallopeptidase [Vicinamibacterales bacterium]HOG27980.1 M48 family metallopeptidase [Vicinamibacterales bacterium]HPW21194.1 M48 family metallopeptidase [Vicinamibacterales bacterium]
MAIDWSDIRYRGDAKDVEELLTTYRVADYLATFEENRRQIDRGVRERLLKEGIRLSERLSPRIYRVFNDVTAALGLETEAEVFCLPSTEINAFAILDVRKDTTYSLVGVTAPALERLDDAELRSILGHELGHILFGNNRLAALISTDASNPSVTVLPALGESLYLRWRKKAEISADRVSVLASRDFRATATSLLKATFGLSERNLNLDIEALVNQVDEIRGKPELMEEVFASHPLLPIRLKAVELFSRSAKAARAGYPVEGEPIADGALEDAVDDLVRLTRRYPAQPLHIAVMRAVALGGAQLLAADRDVSDEEVKILVQILHKWFTDEPEAEIETSREAIAARLPDALDTVRKDGSLDDKVFILTRLMDIALADGALMDPESSIILDVAKHLDVPSKIAYSVIVGSTQSIGFRTDVKLNRMAEAIRRAMKMELKGERAKK